jgi:hypothetical protein
LAARTDEALFRYPGPKPQSKEAAIVLLPIPLKRRRGLAN